MSAACDVAHRLARARPRRRFPFDPDALPRNGIYVVFERGETGHGGDRIVRVGTHTGQGRLPSRMRMHFVTENKDRSIFRKNVGRALLHQRDDPYLPTWSLSLTRAAARREHGRLRDPQWEAEIEREVPRRIQETSGFCVVEVPAGGAAAARAQVAACAECGPSPEWLGRHAPDARDRAVQACGRCKGSGRRR